MEVDTELGHKTEGQDAIKPSREALEDIGDFTVGGKSINTIKYADDLVALSKTKERHVSVLDGD